MIFDLVLGGICDVLRSCLFAQDPTGHFDNIWRFSNRTFEFSRFRVWRHCCGYFGWQFRIQHLKTFTVGDSNLDFHRFFFNHRNFQIYKFCRISALWLSDAEVNSEFQDFEAEASHPSLRHAESATSLEFLRRRVS